MTTLEALARELNDLATRAADGDTAAETRLTGELAALASIPWTGGWPTPGSVARKGLETFVAATAHDRTRLQRLAAGFLDVLVAHPEGLPFDFRPAEQLGEAGVPLLTTTLVRALARTSRAEVEASGEGNPSNIGAFALAADALQRLFAYDGREDAVAAALIAQPWSDDAMWLLFKILAGDHGGRLLDCRPMATVVVGRLVAATASIEGDGATKLRARLVKSKVIPRSAAPGIKVPSLPRRLPLEVAEALALLASWRLTPTEVALGRPARTRELASLATKLGRPLPRELKRLLATHASIGDRQLGPPSTMRELLGDLKDTIADHEQDSDTSPTGRNVYDVRGFDPLRKGIPLGTDMSGDLYFLATGARSSAGTPPVIRFHHGEALVATVAADSLGEYVALELARVYARREGLDREVEKLITRRRSITSGYKP